MARSRVTAAQSLIYFATIAAGGGHVATANAMAEAVHHLLPGAYRTTVSDVMAEFGFQQLDARHKKSWRRLLGRPRLVRAGQQLMDAAPGITRAAQNLLLAEFAKSAARRLDELAPALVVANHGWLATALTLARTRYGMRTPVAIFATEPFDASALWAEPQAQDVLAPSLAARHDLTRLGVPPAVTRVVGYPVRQAFLDAPHQEQARAELQLDDGFTCLLSLGAEGLAGQALPLAEALAASGANLLAVAGRNQPLQQGFAELARRYPRVVPLGFTERMPLLLAAADVVVGKAGPASTMEALAVGRPVIVTAYAGLNEARVVRFLQTRGLGAYAPGTGDVGQELLRWRDAQARSHAAVAAGALDFPGMAQRIAHVLTALARGQQPAHAAQLGPFESTTAASLSGRLTRRGRPPSA